MTDDSHSAFKLHCDSTGDSKKTNEFGMRVMQERAYEKRGEQYLLIKSPPASGKSRALMFIAIDKVLDQGMKKAIIAVPEKTIGASFNNEPLSQFGFKADWKVEDRWNLCNAPGEDGGKVKSVESFLQSEDKYLICTHATLRFALEKLGIESLDDCLLAVDEFHHSSANEGNVLGGYVNNLIERDKAHIVAMTGSYFRGDSEPILSPTDEERFEIVTYTYYEQLNGYEYLKNLDLGYKFYTGNYLDDIGNVINPNEKTIIHIPHVGAREATLNKYIAVDKIFDSLGKLENTEPDPDTGFYLIRTNEDKLLKIADLVDDDAAKRTKVIDALKDPEQKDNKDHVDIIIALGMAKEGFDWIWCEHALTIGYRASLTEIVQIIGRATRDAEGKTTAKFTNLIAEPDSEKELVIDAVNDTLKAISASLLMEQVLAPKFHFTPKNTGALDDYDYGEDGYKPNENNVGVHKKTGELHIEIDKLLPPKSKEAKRIVDKDLDSLIASAIQDPIALSRGTLDRDAPPQQTTVEMMGAIIKRKHPDLDEEDTESVRQFAVARMATIQKAREKTTKQLELLSERHKEIMKATEDRVRNSKSPNTTSFVGTIVNDGTIVNESGQLDNNALVAGVRKFALDVRNLDVDLIDSINPFSGAFEVLGKSLKKETLEQMQLLIAARRTNFTEEEAMELGKRAIKFKEEKNKNPSSTAQDPWEKRMAEGVAWLKRKEIQESNE